MRNGNFPEHYERIRPIIGSYRTYEEWKLEYSTGATITSDWVLTVPMRNGNDFSYFAMLLHSVVLTVPMRNGNMGWFQW